MLSMAKLSPSCSVALQRSAVSLWRAARTWPGRWRSGGAKVLRVDPAEQGWPQRLEEASFVFNLLHGPGGEDGTVQGLFELMKLPYSGCGLLASALTMDKVRTKWLWQGIDLPTPAFKVLAADSDWSKIIEELGTVFVKPALEGSSLGMSKAIRRIGLAGGL